tara:strand:- start:64 stop:450 length:387 start_codon:yes stop_codon:yes gene_type:complete
MKHKEMLGMINSIFTKVKLMHTEGQKEYAMTEDNVFANFERIANQTGFDREMVLWVYLMKHIDGIASYLKGHKSQREDVTGRLTDAIVYLCILWGMIEEEDYKEKLDKEQANDMANQNRGYQHDKNNI